MKKIISLLSTFCVAASVASAQVVVLTDNFNSATFSSGVVSSTVNYGPATASSTHTLGLGDIDGSPAMSIGGGAGSIYLTAALGQSISLASIGDFIQADFNFTTSGGNNANRTLRFGFYQSGPTDTESVGYLIAGANASDASGRNTVLAAETSTSANNFYTSGLSGGTTTVVAGNTTHAAQLRVERTSATQMTITGSWAGTTITPVTHTVGANSATSIDELWFGIQNRGTTFVIDDLVITAIPEPSTYAALFGLVALALVARMRRRG